MSDLLKALALTSLSISLVLVVATEAGANPAAAHGTSTGSLTPQTVEFGGSRDDTPGSVVGRLVEFDSTPLPKILVRIEGPEPEANVRTTVTDDNANFAFVDLAPGTYRFSVELRFKDQRKAYRGSFYPGAHLEGACAVVYETGDWFDVLRFLGFVT